MFQPESASALLDLLTGGVVVRQVLNVELAQVMERRADVVFLLQDDSILHIECQTRNSKEMPYREGMYCLLLGHKYGRRVHQVVLYLGEEKLNMPKAARKARIQTLRDMLKSKFRTLPRWADERLKSATPTQIRRWSRQLVAAKTLEEIVGKR